MPGRTSFARWPLILLAGGVCTGLLLLALHKFAAAPSITKESHSVPVAVKPPVVDQSKDPERLAQDARVVAVRAEIAATLEKIRAAKSQPRASDGALRQDMADARKAMDEAIAQHPRIRAMRDEIVRLTAEGGVANQKCSAALVKAREARSARLADFNKNVNDADRKMGMERKAFLASIGNKKYVKMSEDEQNQLRAIEAKYKPEIQAQTVKCKEMNEDNETIKGYTAAAEAAVAEYKSKEDRISKVEKDIADVGILLQSEDPGIAALQRVLADKTEKWIASQNESPEVKLLNAKLAGLYSELKHLHLQRGLKYCKEGGKTVGEGLVPAVNTGVKTKS